MSFSITSELGDLPIITGGISRGRRNRAPSYDGPIPIAPWEPIQRGNNILYIQNTIEPLFNAIITVHDNIQVPCIHARIDDIILLDNTLQLIPPTHINYWLAQRPEGIRVSDSTGRGRSNIRYTGGVNAGIDYRETLDFNEALGIIITFGALWERRELTICPTLIHEIGHRMTHSNKLSYRTFPERLANQLSGTRVSRNPGAAEALCNTYMFMICYGSNNSAIQNFGTMPVNIQKSPETRSALRLTPAFSEMLIQCGGDWIGRYLER
jgi:hypothetical protein